MKKTAVIAVLAMLVAIDVVFTRFFSYMMSGNIDRLSLQFLPHALSGALFGPVLAAVSCIAGDLVGMLINPAGLSFTPLMTVSAMTRGILYGLLLYKKPVTIARSLGALAVVTIIVDLGMNPVWMRIMYGQAYLSILLAKIPVRLIFIPIAGLILHPVLKAVTRYFGNRV